MKYNESDIKIRRSIPSVDYCKLVDSIVQVQLFVDEYHPEYLTTALPSIIAHVAIDGIEWEDDEKNMFNDDVAQAVLQDDGILGETVRAIQFGYFGIDNVGDYPWYIDRAIDDAEKIIKQRLEMRKPINSVLLSVDSILNKFLTDFDGVNMKEFIGTIMTLTENTSEGDSDTASE